MLAVLFASTLTFAQNVHEGAQAVTPQHHENTFTVGDRAADVTIDLTADYFYSEASWNVYDVVNGTFYYAVDQTFAVAYDNVVVDLALPEGNYEVVCYDAWGDGGIAGVVTMAGEELVSWFSTSYGAEGHFAFTNFYGPENLTAVPNPESTPEAPSVVLSWDAPRALASVNIYRSTGGAFTLIDNVDISLSEYVDNTVAANGSYSYYLTTVTDNGAESMASATVEVTAYVEPAFAIAPESHTFAPVGLLDGVVFYGADNAEYSVTNAGVGSFNVTEDPYFFSGQTDAFNAVVTAAYPYEVSTGSYDFEVEFVPTAAGSFSSLVVVTDDLGRTVRTYPIEGSAYDIPDYDLVENAFVINQDFGLVNDYVVAGASFDGFYNDYDLGTTPKEDVVYKFNVTKESYIEFQAATGVADFALFADGADITEANNLYEDGQTAIDAGTYYFVVSGSSDYGFTLHIEGQEPILVVDPTTLDLGDVPIGAWHEGGSFEVYNDGGQSIHIESASLSDEEGVYSMDYHFNLPTDITSNTLEFNFFLDAETDGVYNAAFLLTDDVTTHIYPITANAYTPVIGDVMENPILVNFTAGSFADANTVAAPMHDNYHMEDGYGDVVYKFSYATDMIINIANDNGSLMAVYSADDVANLSPEQLVPVAETATGDFTNLELWAGDYYLVLAGDPAGTPAYNITFDVVDMPVPGAVTLVTPTDGITDTPLNPTLTWTVGDYTSDVTVYCGTTYPASTVVYDGEVITSFEVEDLAPAQVYFWKVVARNQNGDTSSEQWAFTTMLPYPLYVQGEIFDYENVHLWWNNPFQADIEWTEDFEGGELPDGWTSTTVASGTSAGWIITDNFSSGAFSIPSHTIYAASNDDSNNDDGSEDYIITPSQNLTMGDVAILTFQSYYTGSYGQIATVEVSSDNGATWTVASTLEPADEWTEVTIDLTEYQETDLLIGFHADDAGAWASGWAIDDVNLTLENSLPWENTRDFLGYNVYQDGTLLTAEPIVETEYDVLDLAAGTYVFGVSAVYNEGESDIIEIDPITILGMGAAEGIVSDVDSGDGIEGATVTFTANTVLDEVFVATTAADGTYSIDLPVFNGDYNVVAHASGYADYTNDLVEVDATVTTALNIELGDIPITPSNVVAVASEDDTQAIITWSEAAPGDEFTEDFEAGIPADWTFVDEDGDSYNWDYADGFNAHSGVGCMYSASYINGVGALNPDNYMITPELNIGSLSTLRFWYVGQDPSYAAEHFYVKVSVTDNNPTSFTETVFEATATGDYQEAVIDLSAFAGQTGYIAIEHCEVTDMFYLNIDDISMTNATRVTENNEYVTVTNESLPFRTTGMTQSEIDTQLTQYTNNMNNSNDRQLESYAVYRLFEGEEENPAVWTLLDGNVQGAEYVDTDWETLEQGVYKYAVKAVHTLSESDYGISNKLGKHMLCNAVVIVDLNTGDSPEGASVVFTNTEDPEYVYEATVPASGTVNITNIWKGNYDLTVSLDLYDTYEENVDIDENYFVRNITLLETLATPVNLASEVECSDVHLTWEQGTTGGGSGLATFADDFETGAFAEGWTFDNPTGSNAFGVSDVNPLAGSYGVQTPWGYDINTWMITPEVDVTGDGIVSFLWSSSYYWSVDPYDNCDLFVKVSTDGGSTWESIWTFGDIGVWENFVIYETTLDLSAYAGETVMIAFNEVGNDNANVNVDNVYVGPEAGRSIGTRAISTQPDVALKARSAEGVEYTYLNNNREFIGYNVYRDGNLITSEPIAETEYWDTELAGGVFVYEVSAVYSTGESAVAGPLEVEVEVINAPMNLTAEKQSWNNVELNWDAPSNQPIYNLHWDDGVAYTAIGTNDVFDFDVASRWAVEDLEAYNGMSLTKVSFFPNEEACEYSIRVWTGENATLIVDQVVTDVVIGAWNTVELATPITIDASQELWFGYRANATTGYPAGCDAGPAVAGKGDMIYDAEEGWLSMSEAYGLDYNWNIAGTVMALGDASTSTTLGAIQDVDRTNSSKGVIKSNGVINSDRLVVDRALTGYNIYRDGVQINENLVTIPFYVDFDLPMEPGVGVSFAYNVEAIFESGCISGYSNTAVVDYGTDVNPLDEDAISVYPNPAASFVNVVIPSNIESLRVMNNLGQVVYQENILGNNKVQLNTEQYNAGNYMIQFTTNNGAVLNKRFVIVK